MSRHVQRVQAAVLPEGQSRPDFEIFSDIAEACGKPFPTFDVKEVQDEIEKLRLPTRECSPGGNPNSGKPEKQGNKSGFSLVNEWVEPEANESFPFKLITNNHMFHIGATPIMQKH